MGEDTGRLEDGNRHRAADSAGAPQLIVLDIWRSGSTMLLMAR
jgi:hypothetical protein